MNRKADALTAQVSFTLQLLVGIVLHDAVAPIGAMVMLAVVVCTSLAAIIGWSAMYG